MLRHNLSHSTGKSSGVYAFRFLSKMTSCIFCLINLERENTGEANEGMIVYSKNTKSLKIFRCVGVFSHAAFVKIDVIDVDELSVPGCFSPKPGCLLGLLATSGAFNKRKILPNQHRKATQDHCSVMTIAAFEPC